MLASILEAVKSAQAKSFTEVAAREGFGQTARRLALLPFLAPKLLEAVATCTTPADLTISVLAEALLRVQRNNDRQVITSMPVD